MMIYWHFDLLGIFQPSLIGSLHCRLDYNPKVNESCNPSATEVCLISFILITLSLCLNFVRKGLTDLSVKHISMHVGNKVVLYSSETIVLIQR